jgi:hypothetical protein
VIALVEAVEEVVEVAAGERQSMGLAWACQSAWKASTRLARAPERRVAGGPGSRERSSGAERGVESLFGGSERVGSDCSLVTAQARAARAAVVMAFVVLYVFCTIKTVGFSLPSNMKTFQ